ncbi:bis(5'-nucleosyl)-tetraphosphatase (symmetrical) YqeK [Desulfoscipio gibsoniae]|uniref:bis(5'-nucleosyl)-tetraphosphatase (symmetrical) n=1 Tax=Desulfoscipio gibsoniae DSM 7213 TaxID=767817 RepID=R4KSY6_9FIRM|nr:bis(5'-nucleosyl)-tetraphosphatase (symmetrical) YqeK [Desulfoscipio gibsoniae]AGL02711.1 putative HD superfamily hydrolase of NAD metabolism [Desulfoscipio gibsoniae DSM 7213]
MRHKYYLECLRGMLGYKRIQHSLGVRVTASRLAELYGADREQAAIAGLLHDCGRDLPGEELLALARQHLVPVDDIEEALPVLLHAPVGALLARQQFGVEDEAVLRAIDLHTLGGETMTLLDKIVFVADKMEPGRVFPGVAELRQIAQQNLDRAVLWCFDAAITLSVRNGELIHPRAVHARNGVRLKLT